MSTNQPIPPTRLALQVITPPKPPVAKEPPDEFKPTTEHAEALLNTISRILGEKEHTVVQTDDLSDFYDAYSLTIGTTRDANFKGKINTKLNGVYELHSLDGVFKLRDTTTELPVPYTLGLLKYKSRMLVLQQVDGERAAIKLIEPANWLSVYYAPFMSYSQVEPQKIKSENPDLWRTFLNLDSQKALIEKTQQVIANLTRRP